MESFDIPVLLVMFNRPDMALQVFERIRQVKPTALYLTIDGPRTNRPADNEAVLACRAIESYVDWPCIIKTLYRTENLGCKLAVSSAITWFFEQVEMGIILEDDCLPDLTFFSYCRILLNKYANDHKVMHIGGANIYGDKKWGSYSYFFSYIPHIWGWATWRRAWKHYDVNIKSYPDFKISAKLNEIVSYSPSRIFWEKTFDDVYDGKIDTWDFQWVFTLWKNQGLSIIPNQNLISNIGFGELATHTTTDSVVANLPTVQIDINMITHPERVIINREAVNYAFSKLFTFPTLWQTRINQLVKIFFKQKKKLSKFITYS